MTFEFKLKLGETKIFDRSNNIYHLAVGYVFDEFDPKNEKITYFRLWDNEGEFLMGSWHTTENKKFTNDFRYTNYLDMDFFLKIQIDNFIVRVEKLKGFL